GRGDVDLQRAYLPVGVLALPLRSDQAAQSSVAAACADIDVLRDARQRHDAFLFAVLRAKQHTGGNGVTRRFEVEWPTFQKQPPCFQTVQPTEQAQQLGAPRPHQAEEAQDFALVRAETDRFTQPRAQQPLGPQRFALPFAGAVVINVLNVAPDHASDQLVLVELIDLFKGADEATVLEYRDRVVDEEDYFHPMRDVEHHFAVVAKLADDGHQSVDFPGRQAAGRLVKGNHMGIARHRLGNFHQLPLPQRQTAQAGTRV